MKRINYRICCRKDGRLGAWKEEKSGYTFSLRNDNGVYFFGMVSDKYYGWKVTELTSGMLINNSNMILKYGKIKKDEVIPATEEFLKETNLYHLLEGTWKKYGYIQSNINEINRIYGTNIEFTSDISPMEEFD